MAGTERRDVTPTVHRLRELSGETPPEPICERTYKRFIVHPGKEPEIWALYKQMQASLWTVEEADLSVDVRQWSQLADSERYFLSNVLAFFACADGIVNENIANNFHDEITVPEARTFYELQLAVEAIHNETYSTLISAFIEDGKEQDRLFSGMESIPAVKAKTGWAMQWMDPELASLAERLVAFTCVEGIAFQGCFCAIFWLKKQGKMPGLAFLNELISRDENLHMQFGALMYSRLQSRLPEARIHEIVHGAVDAEIAFVTEAFSCALVGLSAASMTQFIKSTANVVCGYLGVGPAYPGVSNPFEWMALMDFRVKANFFERKASDYQKPHLVINAASSGSGSASASASCSLPSDATSGAFSLDMDF